MTIGKPARWVESGAFDAIGVRYEFNSPIFYFKYFLSEAMVGAITAPIMQAFNLLFELTPVPAPPNCERAARPPNRTSASRSTGRAPEFIAAPTNAARTKRLATSRRG